VAKKAVAKKAVAKKAVAKKAVAKKSAVKKPAASAAKATTGAKKSVPSKKKAAPGKATKSTPKKRTHDKVAANNATATKPVTPTKDKPAVTPKKGKPAPEKKVTAKKRPARKRKPSKPANPFPYTSDGVIQFTPYPIRKRDEYMDDDQVEHFRSILYGWKHQLMEEVDRTLHHMQDEAANFPDPNDRATQESEFTLELRTRDRERKLIKKIDEAVASLEMGDYGFCETCGIEIGIRRLEARPTATLCIDCKVLDEIRERQMG